jgi:hypothetical protein
MCTRVGGTPHVSILLKEGGSALAPTLHGLCTLLRCGSTTAHTSVVLACSRVLMRLAIVCLSRLGLGTALRRVRVATAWPKAV